MSQGNLSPQFTRVKALLKMNKAEYERNISEKLSLGRCY